MGLDVGGAHWAYSGFHRFRQRLAKAIGIDLDQMEGFGGDRRWEEVDDAIVPLLSHSDCDGEMSPEECARVAPRLRELVEGWSDDPYDWQNALRLAESMERCALEGRALQFR